MAFKWEEPSNPFATQDFKNAVKEATEKLGKELGKIGEQMQANVADAKISFIDFDDMPTEYSGAMRLKYEGTLHLSDLLDALLENGYEVTAKLEDVTEAEREVDGADKFVVIEYGEVE